MLTKQGMQKHSEGESWDKQKTKQQQKKPHSKHWEKSAFHWSQGQSFWCRLGLRRHSHKNLTTTLYLAWENQTLSKFKVSYRGWARLEDDLALAQQTYAKCQGHTLTCWGVGGLLAPFSTALKNVPPCITCTKESQLNNKCSWRTRKKEEAFDTSMTWLKGQRLCK